MARYVVHAPNVAAAAERLACATNEAFERRSSDYWGDYCLVTFLAGDLRVFANLDPMYRANLDPPEEARFEPRFGPDRVLIDDGGDPRAEPVIRSVFPDAVRIDGSTAA